MLSVAGERMQRGVVVGDQREAAGRADDGVEATVEGERRHVALVQHHLEAALGGVAPSANTVPGGIHAS